MPGGEARCSICGRTIEGDETVLLKMRYPKRKGFTEIKAYLKNEARFVCEKCFGERWTERD
ncbi:Fe3+ hydroxamate ABC transporter substrate-binding protein [Saccharibacillus alkalitolerans]|uniref:Fe3+ hydroxamate ABC transporter substrate-binding protein n=1 Tax=Saccharibacillus alkalitolerans TaxID=2705290 RepID=A0ABX0FA61_9BACL|nr:Fe3+ hydroxamate ABC transporter substrate-binding protein [Saccharibacillus alkalitolerans]NGZ76364.1 Fe3+ hydroxamate ABC transporter substrate-binding protein [Saccharibacillus alkalitolerans]